MVTLGTLVQALLDTLRDVLPIALVILVFQGAILRRRPANLRLILLGGAHVVVGLALFRVGLDTSLLPIGEYMSDRLVPTAPGGWAPGDKVWWAYFPLYGFAAAIGFVTTLVEPTLTAVADRVRLMTGGAVRSWTLRLVVATGVSLGLLVGTLRIVLGFPLPYTFAGLALMVAVLAALAPRAIVPLAFDCGGFATSVVTVPVIAAFAVGVARAVPGRDPLTDGFGLILFALLGPAAAVLTFASIRARLGKGADAGERHAVQADPGPGR
jgi:hypothetical protein